MKFKLGKIKEFGKKTWGKEKKKAAVFLKISEKMGGKMLVRQTMKLEWYRHIDKALRGEITYRDAKHWKKMRRKFKKNIVGEPSQETLNLLKWLKEFEEVIKRGGDVRQGDYEKWLPRFKEYMQSCEENAMDLYIAKNDLMEE
jgi:hypothetical protein